MSTDDEQDPLKTPPASTTNGLPPDFDAGINTSAAWTESRDKGRSLSDEETDPNDPELDYLQVPGRPARALYSFEGKPEFREVRVNAGDGIEIIREEVGDGWSLVKLFVEGGVELGLLPRSYYTFTADFTSSPTHDRREASTASITPRGSPKLDPQLIVPQHTGEWFPSFRRNLMGGKSFNRFSSFVTSGAEEWILTGAPEDRIPPPVHHRLTSEPDEVVETTLSKFGIAEEDIHYVDEGPSWKIKLPPFRILVHSPAKRTSHLTGSYTVYGVTSLFRPPGSEDDPETESHRVTVQRRFSHFVALHTVLSRRLPGIVLPPLPEKQYAGRFSDAFIEARRGDLERYIGRVVRHPVARYAEVLTFFLSCEDELEWKRGMPKHLNMPPAGPSFYAHVFHPAYNLDTEELAETANRFANHTRAVGKGVQGLRNTFSQVRQARVEMSRVERLLSYSLLALVTSKPLASASTTLEGEDEIPPLPLPGKGALNTDGAWCWREGCADCLKLTKSMQKVADTLQSVADMFDDHARRTQLVTHEALKGVSHPYATYVPIVDTHVSTVTRYHEALASTSEAHEEINARCETVLNTTMAEMEAYHSQKIEDFETLTKEHLDGEIQLYEQILSKLKSARGNFDEPLYGSLAQTPRQPSIFERELEYPRLTNPPLTQPTPHVFDSAPMRPVSVAIQEGVGLFLNAPRSTVFGKFW